MIKLQPESSCTGCGACANACLHECIHIKYNNDGFLMPSINKDKCIECGACVRACPINKPKVLRQTIEPKVYACWNKDRDTRIQSTSGGIFSAIASTVIDMGGWVFASEMDECLNVRFTSVKSKAELNRVRGSKYTQSMPGTVYIDVKRALSAGTKVLFVGCPCQVAGLYSYLGGHPEGLFTVDLVCHGVASNKYFKEYVEKCSKQKGSAMIKFYPRNKKRGWTNLTVCHEYADGSKRYLDSERDAFMRPYFSALFYRLSCYECQFNGIPRVADITLGDYFSLRDDGGYQGELFDGISMMMINSTKGEQLFDAMKSHTVYSERDIKEVIEHNSNIIKSCKLHRNREKFLHKNNHILPLVNIVYSPTSWRNGVYMNVGSIGRKLLNKIRR